MGGALPARLAVAVLALAASDALVTRRSALSTALVALLDRQEARVSLPCGDSPSCVSTTDDAARGGKAFAEPWTYEKSLKAARDRL